MLCRFWSLKEAYVKALGSGLTDDLNKVEFCHTSWINISAKVAGKEMTEWRFWLFELEKRHCVSYLYINFSTIYVSSLINICFDIPINDIFIL